MAALGYGANLFRKEPGNQEVAFLTTQGKAMTTIDSDRIRISAEIEQFLQAGGKIDKVDHTSNRDYLEPIKRSRKEQIGIMRKRSF